MNDDIKPQEWFEFRLEKARRLDRAVWIPLRASKTISKIGEHGQAGFVEEFFGVGSIAVPISHRAKANELDWGDVGIAHSHSGYVDDDVYHPANERRLNDDDAVAEHLVLEMSLNSEEARTWHLLQDLEFTLGLKREGDVWVRPSEEYMEVVRLHLDSDRKPILIEMRAAQIKDYLCARGMALYVTSYRQRVQVLASTEHISWTENPKEEQDGVNQWSGRIVPIDERGFPAGMDTYVSHVGRTDVDPAEEVPEFSFPTDKTSKHRSCTIKGKGPVLHRIEGELWRNEWVEPGTLSTRVRGDEDPQKAFFITDASGTMESDETLENKGSRWLWFRPEVMHDLLSRRGSALWWYTRDTGKVCCAPDHAVHFGVNSLGLVNVYAKDIGRLPAWQQRIWAGHNIIPEGGVSEELLAAQMKAEPARTLSPEDHFEKVLELLNTSSTVQWKIRLLRKHDHQEAILQKVHRFRATDKAGLYALAKDLARLTADSFDTGAIQSIVIPPKGEKWGSLKSLEKLLAMKVGPQVARDLLGPLHGVYTLRLADAHLPGSELSEALLLVGIEEATPIVHQGYQLLFTCVDTLYKINGIIQNWDALKPSQD